MTDQTLRPATDAEISYALSFALPYEGHKRVTQGDELIAGIAAERLVRYLKNSGFVIMKKPDSSAPANAAHMPVAP